VVEERAEGLADGALVGERLRQQVGGRADLEHDPALTKLRHQARITRGEDAVADPVRAERLDHLPDLLDAELAAFLADVNRDAEPGGASLVDERGQLRIGVTLAVRPRP